MFTTHITIVLGFDAWPFRQPGLSTYKLCKTLQENTYMERIEHSLVLSNAYVELYRKIPSILKIQAVPPTESKHD